MLRRGYIAKNEAFKTPGRGKEENEKIWKYRNQQRHIHKNFDKIKNFEFSGVSADLVILDNICLFFIRNIHKIKVKVDNNNNTVKLYCL